MSNVCYLSRSSLSRQQRRSSVRESTKHASYLDPPTPNTRITETAHDPCLLPGSASLFVLAASAVHLLICSGGQITDKPSRCTNRSLQRPLLPVRHSISLDLDFAARLTRRRAVVWFLSGGELLLSSLTALPSMTVLLGTARFAVKGGPSMLNLGAMVTLPTLFVKCESQKRSGNWGG